MLSIFTKKGQNHESEIVPTQAAQAKDFDYLPARTFYFDSACQTIRPQAVLDAESDYYHQYNACGGRVKYDWGKKVDEKVEETRSMLLKMVGKSAKDYAVVFTLNTTYGINLVLQQLPPEGFQRIITSDIEHNSVFLPSLTWASRHKIERIILQRDEEGSLLWQEQSHLDHAVLLVNTVSNIDGRSCKNLAEVSKAIHAQGGIVLLDAAQHFAHDAQSFHDIEFDALFGSGHKMYGPSIGFIIIRKELIRRLELFFLGGGTVYDVQKDRFTLANEPHEIHSVLEVGLQNWAGIIGLGAAVRWRQAYKPEGQAAKTYEKNLEAILFQGLKDISGLHLLNSKPSPIISFYKEGLDSHRLALYLNEQGIMCRSGYFCCHYFLKNLKQYPPLLRVSLGLHNTPEQIEHFLKVLQQLSH